MFNEQDGEMLDYYDLTTERGKKNKKRVYTPWAMCYIIQGEFSPCSGTGNSDHPLICGGPINNNI